MENVFDWGESLAISSVSPLLLDQDTEADFVWLSASFLSVKVVPESPSLSVRVSGSENKGREPVIEEVSLTVNLEEIGTSGR